ncbi:MAG: hypothetical protein JXA78_07970 [Anaerolineales bacterium]|nr:hypothetical protein [Anaerolineales bacterium]
MRQQSAISRSKSTSANLSTSGVAPGMCPRRVRAVQLDSSTLRRKGRQSGAALTQKRMALASRAAPWASRLRSPRVGIARWMETGARMSVCGTPRELAASARITPVSTVVSSMKITRC